MKKDELKEKIGDLEHENGRLHKKISDQEHLIAQLREKLHVSADGVRELCQAADALLARLVEVYGETARDPETGEALGLRLTVPLFDVSDMLARYEVHARMEKAENAYVIGVVLRTGGGEETE